MAKTDAATESREDISRFVVHLTRDDTKDFNNGGTARENLISIIKARQILATRPHCIFNAEINKFKKAKRAKFNVACFTEIPLSQLHLIARKILGRKTELEEYGLVFRKQLLIESGAQPAIYVNSYDSNNWLREAARELFDTTKDNEDSKLWRFVPFLNAMHEKHDFSWEREWRTRKNFKFKLDDIVAVILPNDSEEKLKLALAKAGIAAISPTWRYEQIVYELAQQQRNTKRVTLDSKVKAKSRKTGKNDA